MIGGTLEYLMSSLPNLTFQNTEAAQRRVRGLLRKYAGDAAKKSSPVQLLDREARKFLPAAEFAVFQQINLNNIHEAAFQTKQNKVLRAYSAFALELKVALREWRKQAGASEKKAWKDLPARLIDADNPLEREVRLMQYQWNTLEELAIGHYADAEALFSYKIKLMILERWWSFDREKGFQRFLQMTTNN
jgi:hypothetical protein